jgi:hypothetical protein
MSNLVYIAHKAGNLLSLFRKWNMKLEASEAVQQLSVASLPSSKQTVKSAHKRY